MAHFPHDPADEVLQELAHHVSMFFLVMANMKESGGHPGTVNIKHNKKDLKQIQPGQNPQSPAQEVSQSMHSIAASNCTFRPIVGVISKRHETT